MAYVDGCRAVYYTLNRIQFMDITRQIPPLESLTWLQGRPEDHELQVGCLIQVNCPGCHQHALPVANLLFDTPERNYGVYIVSTAFEDFDLNTLENTRALLQGRLVGVPRDRLGAVAPSVPRLPLAYDTVVPKEGAHASLIQTALEVTKQSVRDSVPVGTDRSVLESHLARLDASVLPEKLAALFWSAQACGTPFWYIHHGNRVLDTKFGEMDLESLQQWIASQQQIVK